MAEGNEQKVNSTATIGRHKQRLGELIDLIGTISLLDSGSSSGRESAQTSPADDQSRLTSAATIKERKTHRSVDLLGRVYEYFLTRFASAEGKNGGVAKCEVRSASVEVKTLRPFVIRNSSFDISRADFGPEHADTFRSVQHPDLRADWQIANAEVRMWN